nr:hypothetical protein [Klebsiella michiganensis]
MSPAGGGYRISARACFFLVEYVPRWRGLSVSVNSFIAKDCICPLLAGVIGRQK